ncbi:Homeodomain-like protein [Aspergillus coremiiformis]|uniref:Homeodomain-like protein n=1 Tax=Aspergillus coremiiformis TaxID=138285 RepID=A0A5N6YU21_9EURO|nr:Homeodomain-like protein [Aspergillus coremiiformis]
MVPTHRRGPWVPEEDQLLLQLVREQGPNNWVRISQHMHYRSPKQCRERFHQNLKPSLNREPISADEGLVIERMVNEMGKRWAEIARRLGNRSDNAVKNWWNGSMNRKRRGLPTSSTTHISRTFSGRIEAPYTRASVSLTSPTSRSRFTPISADRPLTSWSRSTSRRDSTSSRQLTPIYTLPALNRPVESPLTSPSYSEVSHAPSLKSPSMSSDHNSVSSASPRTVSSPQLLPLPVDTRQQYGEFRKQSATDDFYVISYQSSKPQEPLTELPFNQPWNQHSASLSQSWLVPSPEPRSEAPKAEPLRDSRMGLSNLLN